MKRWITTLIICHLYIVVVVLDGFTHDYHGEITAAPAKHCAACAWHVAGVADVPVVTLAIIVWLTQVPLSSRSELFPSSIFYSETPSRAPPAA